MDKVIQVLRDFPIEKIWVSKELHFNRNKYNLKPEGTLICRRQSMFVDDITGHTWLKMPWWYNIFHNPFTNVKMLHYDSNLIDIAPGSSEIIVPKKYLQLNSHDGSVYVLNTDIKEGSYNYRDGFHGFYFKHFVADILPNLIYWKRRAGRPA